MAWARMLFKGQPVVVRVDAGGKPILDGGGRAEMKYREDDNRVYRPAPGNLVPGGEGQPLSPPRRKAAGGTSNGKRGEPAQSRAGEATIDWRQPATAERVDVWTDGACSGNPGPMGIGVVVIIDGQRRELGEYLGVGTNNIAELVAIERGLEMASEKGGDRGRPIHVYSDSGYAIGVLSKGWKAKANQDLVARVRRTLARHPKARLVKVPGHAGVPENERCDELARNAVTSRGSR
jgi:ribonuclease HI